MKTRSLVRRAPGIAPRLSIIDRADLILLMKDLTMSSSIRRTIGVAAMVTLMVTLYVTLHAATWNAGDVIVSISNSSYQVYTNSGIFKETISWASADGSGDLAGGCAFDSSFNLYATNFTDTHVIKFNGNHPHGVLQVINTAGPNEVPAASSESISFAANGDFYVGNADGNADVHRYNPAGVFQQAYDVATELRGSDHIELSSDQKTLFYTSEGGRILRFDLSTGTQLPDFANIGGNSFALRLLPPGDGSTGLLVANFTSIKRLNALGAVVATYDATGEDSWFALNLDPNGTSFWSGGLNTSKFYRFNIVTGAVEVGPINTGADAGTMGGICLKGEPVAGIPPMPSQEGNQTYTPAQTSNTWHFDAGLRSFMLTATAVNTPHTIDVKSTDTVATLTEGPFAGATPVIVTPRGTGAIYQIVNANGQPTPLPEPGVEYTAPLKLKLGWTFSGPVCRPHLLRNPHDDAFDIFTEDKSTGFNMEAVDPVETAETCCMSKWGVYDFGVPPDAASVNFMWIRPSAAGTDSFKLGRVIPIQFRLTRSGMPITDEVAYIAIARFVGHPLSTAEAIDVDSPGNQEGTRFKHIGNGVYQYLWQTKGEVAGFYNIGVLPNSTCVQSNHATLKER